MKTETNTPANMIAAAAQNAARKPSVSADGTAVPLASVVGRRDGDRREDRDPDRPADLLRRVDEPRGEAGLLRLRSGDGRDRHGHERERESESDQEKAGNRSVQYEPSTETWVK